MAALYLVTVDFYVGMLIGLQREIVRRAWGRPDAVKEYFFGIGVLKVGPRGVKAGNPFQIVSRYELFFQVCWRNTLRKQFYVNMCPAALTIQDISMSPRLYVYFD